MNPRRFLGPALLLGAFAAGCATTPAPAAAPPAASDGVAFSLPLDGYQPTQQQLVTLDNARLGLLTECLARFGFTVTFPPVAENPLPDGPRTDALRYGRTSESLAAVHGYKSPQRGQGPKAAEPDLPPEALSILTGKGGSAGGREVPPGGCGAEATRTLAEADPEPGGDLVTRLGLTSYERMQQDPRVRAKFAEWSSCMRRAGYDYREPKEANGDPRWRGPSPSAAEKATAVADVRCKKETGAVGVQADVESEIQRGLVEQNAEALAGVKTVLENQLRNAARLTGR